MKSASKPSDSTLQRGEGQGLFPGHHRGDCAEIFVCLSVNFLSNGRSRRQEDKAAESSAVRKKKDGMHEMLATWHAAFLSLVPPCL